MSVSTCLVNVKLPCCREADKDMVVMGYRIPLSPSCWPPTPCTSVPTNMWTPQNSGLTAICLKACLTMESTQAESALLLVWTSQQLKSAAAIVMLLRLHLHHTDRYQSQSKHDSSTSCQRPVPQEPALLCSLDRMEAQACQKEGAWPELLARLLTHTLTHTLTRACMHARKKSIVTLQAFVLYRQTIHRATYMSYICYIAGAETSNR